VGLVAPVDEDGHEREMIQSWEQCKLIYEISKRIMIGRKETALCDTKEKNRDQDGPGTRMRNTVIIAKDTDAPKRREIRER
jgi:hypothetical protein